MDMGPFEVRPFLHSFFGDRAKGPAQTRETLAAIAAQPMDARLLLVTHQVNISALTGVVPASGEIIVVQRRPDGSLEVSGRVSIAP